VSQNSTTKFESAIYKGIVRHRRFGPSKHEFEYPLFMFLFKVDEIPNIFKTFWQLSFSAISWARFKRKDYIISDHDNLAVAVKSKIAEQLDISIKELDGEVFFLGHLRYFGFYFSPLNVYFLKQANDFTHMLAEVSNTPWHEKHYYALDLENLQRHPKEFHVSPFNPMDQTYQWRIKPPGNSSKSCLVHIESYTQNTDNKVFDATLNLKRRPLNRNELNRVLIKTPMQTASVVFGIYWQALKLFLKRTPFYKYPIKSEVKVEKGTS
tara:strand:- start:136 stop:933 length:798 start_codon:yes stop_codon:yes gene_type:complete